MATQTLSNFDAVLKNAYRGTPIELLNQKTYLLDKIQNKNALSGEFGTFTGRQIVFATHVSRNRGRGALTDGGTLPAAGRQGYLDGIVTPKYFSQSVELTDMVIEQSKTDEGAFVRAMDVELPGAMKDLKKDITRMVYGTGDGLLAACTATDSTTTTIHVASTQYIAIGDTVDLIVRSSGATGTGAVGRTVTAVAPSTTPSGSSQTAGTITISGANISVDNTYGVYITGNRSNESDGLQNIFSTGRVLHQIDSSANPIWDSNVKAAGWVNANEDLFMQIAQQIEERSGEDIDRFLTTLGVMRRLANTYQSQKRWNDDRATQIEGGYSAINIAAGGKTTPVVADIDCPRGFAFPVNDDSLVWSELAPMDWLTPPNGGGMFILKDGASAGQKQTVWQAFVKWYATLVCVAPLRGGTISQLNDDVPIQRY